MNINKAAEALWNLHAQEQSWDELSVLEQGQMRSEAAFVVEAAHDDAETTGLRDALRALIDKAGDQHSMPWLTPVRVVSVAALEQVLTAHQHEAWQIRDSAQGGRYCAACGQGVS